MHTLFAALATTTVLAVSGCGDDDGGGDGDLEAYCELSASQDDAVDLPSGEVLDEFVDTAPPEIRDDVETLVDAIRDIDSDNPEEFLVLLEDEDVVQAGERIDAFEAENCPGV